MACKQGILFLLCQDHRTGLYQLANAIQVTQLNSKFLKELSSTTILTFCYPPFNLDQGVRCKVCVCVCVLCYVPVLQVTGSNTHTHTHTHTSHPLLQTDFTHHHFVSNSSIRAARFKYPVGDSEATGVDTVSF